MVSYGGPERRRNPRVHKNFVVNYRIYGDPDNIDISQTKNISEGGMLLTTNCAFDNGTILAIEIKLPFISSYIRLLGKVLESKEIAHDLIYETRLVFNYMDDQSKEFVRNTVNYFSKKETK
ncbi:MAG: PilZ domain-containing protein [Candidatus Omnitrophica bacterium]|nr:PilZ domain-containing protein [Candidatus Omnitrophota bacterium]MDD5352554.1 PilZ domain-containing protein [Candidatus Omnitrophota bacterium]MDD5550152.1 PilZ domain-containing protein [Candidatus Omnitrophota bacterium]